MVRSRTLLINEVRSIVKGAGGRLPVCSTAAFPKKAAAFLPQELIPACSINLELIAATTRAIKEMDEVINAMIVERYPVALHLQQVGGVGPLTALAFVLTLFDPDRFPKSRQVGAYLGLVPRRHQSGERDPHLGITHAGNPYLRRLLVSAAHYIIGPFGKPSDLRSWGLNLAAKGPNAKKRAVVGVARRLAVLLHHLWVTGEVYEPCRLAPAEVAA
jgi:transposase